MYLNYLNVSVFIILISSSSNARNLDDNMLEHVAAEMGNLTQLHEL